MFWLKRLWYAVRGWPLELVRCEYGLFAVQHDDFGDARECPCVLVVIRDHNAPEGARVEHARCIAQVRRAEGQGVVCLTEYESTASAPLACRNPVDGAVDVLFHVPVEPPVESVQEMAVTVEYTNGVVRRDMYLRVPIGLRNGNVVTRPQE